MSNQEQPKTQKPKDDWKLQSQAKKLKKEQDRQKQRQKQKPQQSTSTHKPKQEQAKKTIEYVKEVKQQQPTQKTVVQPPRVLEETEKKVVEKNDEKVATQAEILEPILSRRWKKIRNTPAVDIFISKLLEHTTKYISQDDSILIGSKHDVCRRWFESNASQVIDVFNLSEGAIRRDNIIRTRFEDIGYFSHTITKIICGATAIYQNGVVLSDSGSLFLAILAKQFRIPFIVLCESQRYCDTSLLQGDLKENEGSTYDIIQPELISMLITEAGPISAISVSTLIAEMDKV